MQQQAATTSQGAGQLTANSRYIELQYETPKGYKTPHYHPGEEEELEKRLISLKRRKIQATVVNLLTGEVVGGTDEGLFHTNRGRIARWNYWYSPEGLDAKEQPAGEHKKIVCDLSRF